MDDSLERVFELRAPVERVWRAFTEPRELEAWWAPEVSSFEAKPGGDIRYSIPGFGQHRGRVLEVGPLQLLRWEEGPGHIPGTTQVAVTFESTPAGARVHAVHSGFGEGAEWLGKLESVAQGWSNCIADLTLYLETGVRYNRMFTWRWGLGAGIENTQAGARVVRVDPGTFAARAGLRVGDLIVRLAGAPVFDLSDLWLICREHETNEEIEAIVVRGRDLARVAARPRA